MEGPPIPETLTGLEEPTWQLALGGVGQVVYPERPGEPDCGYFMRTGTCRYGDRCRYNHPRDRAIVAEGGRSGGGEYPERVGQPICQYFMKTGTCKFGASCKYHHPRQGGSVPPLRLNSYGYPLRPGEKECAYYMKSGHCKFGLICKFHHPELDTTSVRAPAPPFYPVAQSPSAPSTRQFPAVASWQVASSPPPIPGSYVQGPYGPMVFSPGVVPMSGWGPYQPHVNPVVPSGSQLGTEAASLYGISYQLSPSTPTYLGPYHPVSSSAGPSSSGLKESLFPERPGQPECQFYMKTGACKFGSLCKYHHPPERNAQKAGYVLSPIGLPLHPGAQVCTFYLQHGTCRFGPRCKFDHPMGPWNYNTSESSRAETSVVSFPTELPAATLAPSSSTTSLQHESIAGTSNKDSFANQMPLSGNVSSSSIGSTFSKGGTASQSLVETPIKDPTSSSTSSSSIVLGGKKSGSI